VETELDFRPGLRRGVPLTVHPGIGYDIISNHPMFNGAAIGRAAGIDFRIFGGVVEGLDGGVVLSLVRPLWRRRFSRRASVA